MTTPQAVTRGLTNSAIFLSLSLKEDSEAVDKARDLLGDISSLVKAIGFRSSTGELSCITGIGSQAWDRLFDLPRPKELHEFKELNGIHHAPSTPGDLFFHIRAMRMDLCFELETAILERLDGVVERIDDEVQGFRYFDRRDLLGFVDGTENPQGNDIVEAVLIDEEDPQYRGSSYVIVQNYLHNLDKWNKIPHDEQERIIGRKKLSDIELSDDEKPAYAHNAVNIIKDKDGNQLDIFRDNMPFGSAAEKKFGTYFIGYCRTPERIEEMLRKMFIGDENGVYDHILDVSTAVTGTLFFIPTVDFLDDAPDSPKPKG